MAGVRMLADEAIRDGRQVTLLFGAASAREVYPSTLLPDEVESSWLPTRVVGHHGFVTDLVPEYEAWADQAFACGPWPMLAALARLAEGRRGRLGVASSGGNGAGAGPTCPVRPPRAEGGPAGVDGAEHGLRGGRVPRVRGANHQRDATAGVPGGPGVRRRGARLGGGLVTARSARTRTRTAGRTPDVDLSVDLGRGLVLPNPILVASGTFGYGIEYGDVVEVDRLGAICCKGTTLKPRIGNPTPRVTETPGGMLNSIGLQNPGVDAVVEKYAATWAGWRVPVW